MYSCIGCSHHKGSGLPKGGPLGSQPWSGFGMLGGKKEMGVMGTPWETYLSGIENQINGDIRRQWELDHSFTHKYMLSSY